MISIALRWNRFGGRGHRKHTGSRRRQLNLARRLTRPTGANGLHDSQRKRDKNRPSDEFVAVI
jgi:hypothetical protein